MVFYKNMKNKKIKKLVVIIIIIFITTSLFILIIDLTNHNSEEKYMRGENTIRITLLKQLHESILEYIKETDKAPKTLFSVLSYLHKNKYKLPTSITMPYEDNSYFISDFLTNDFDFTQKSDYKLVKINNNDWGIIELKFGKFGKYYFIINQHGEIYKIKSQYFDSKKIKNNSFPYVNLLHMLKNKQADKDFEVIDPPRKKDFDNVLPYLQS